MRTCKTKTDSVTGRLLLVSMLVLALGWASPMRATTLAGNPSSPEQIVRISVDDLLHEIHNRNDEFRRDPEVLYRLVGNHLLPHFDFNKIGALTLGRFASDASPDQISRYIGALQHSLIRSYSNILLEYQDQRIDWAAPRATSDTTEVIVRAVVSSDGRPPIPITLKMSQDKGVWKIYDLAIDSISLVSTYRSSFVPELKKNGIESLIVRLESKQ